MGLNPFLKKPEEYKRDLNIVRAYVSQSSFFLHRMTNTPYEECKAFVKESIGKSGRFALVDPEMISLVKDKNGDRVKENTTFLNYIRETSERGYVMSPSMTCFISPNEDVGVQPRYIRRGIKKRSIAKKEMFSAELAKDYVLYAIKNGEQGAAKIKNNSLSGMALFAKNILYFKSGHPVLTSTCRSGTGYGNLSNEKFVGGNRHYQTLEITLSSMLAIVTNTDLNELGDVIEKFGIVYPTTEMVMSGVITSINEYWGHDTAGVERLRSFVDKLLPVERAAILYIGDMFHLCQYNPVVVMRLFDALIKPDLDAIIITDPEVPLNDNATDPDKFMYINLMASDILAGESRKTVKETNPEGYLTIAKYAVNLERVLEEYSDFIRVLFTTTILSPMVSDLPDMTRDIVLGSDTDSSLSQTQSWVEWYTGSLLPSKEGKGIWYTVVYFASQVIAHDLAKMCANMGVVPEHMGLLAMKNEYMFPAFARTTRAKHYFAASSAREGNVYKKHKLEIKGVQLVSSKTPECITDRLEEMAAEILDYAWNGKQFSIHRWYGELAYAERTVANSISRGEATYLKTDTIKPKYKVMESSPYQHYLLWEEVFAPKYGAAPPPPYTALRLTLDINSKSDMELWYNEINEIDTELSSRLKSFVTRTRKTGVIRTLRVPESVISEIGLPKEILTRFKVRTVVGNVLESYYIALESLGLFVKDEKTHRIVSDVYNPDTHPQCKELIPRFNELYKAPYTDFFDF